MRERLARLAPEEIAGIVLLAVVLAAVAVDPRAVGRIFESPYATPAPESGADAVLRETLVPAPSARSPVFPGAPRVIFVDRSGAVQDPQPSIRPELQQCWQAAMAAIRAGGQPVVCAVPPPTFLSR